MAGAGGLTSVVTCNATGEYLVLLANPSLVQQNFTLSSRIGDVDSIVEVPLPQGEKEHPGFVTPCIGRCSAPGAV